MRQYEKIEKYIEQARLERSAYLGQLVSSGIAASRDGLRRTTRALLCAARTKSTKNVFSFDS